MKYLYFFALAAVIPTAAPAQTYPDPSGLSVLKKQWRMVSVSPRNSVLYEDPFKAVDENNRALREVKLNARQNQRRTPVGVATESMPDSITPPVKTERSHKYSIAYIYEIRVRNDGVKTIKLVVWDYVFLDPKTQDEVGRHRFISEIDLKPRGTENVVARLASAPSGTIDIKYLGKKPSELFFEQIVIRGVEFADGTIWQPDPE